MNENKRGCKMGAPDRTEPNRTGIQTKPLDLALHATELMQLSLELAYGPYFPPRARLAFEVCITLIHS